MPLALFLALLFLALGTIWLFAQSWLPHAAAVQAIFTDRHLHWNLLLFAVLFLASQLTLGYLVWRFRDRGQSSVDAQPSLRFELFWMFLTAIIFFGVNTVGFLNAAASHTSKSDFVRIEVTGEQFRWYFRYPGADQTFGKTRIALIDASLGNPLGLDRNDPEGKDDRVSSELVLPVDRDIEVTLRAHDVIHSFFVTEFRVKMDAVPGMTNTLRFTPNRTGRYELVCAELCGLGHHQMNAVVRVVTAEEYRRFLESPR